MLDRLAVFASIGGLTNCETSKLAPGMWCSSYFSLYSKYLTPRKAQAEERGEDQDPHQQVLLAHLGRPHRQRHEEAGRDEDGGIGRAHADVQRVRRGDERVVVPVAVEQVGEEHSAEEHDFRQQEEPHAEAAGLALLLLRLEVVTVLRHEDVFVFGVLVLGCVVSIALSNGRHLLCGLVFEPLVVVGFVVHDGNLGKVLGQRRRLDLPLEAGCLPRIVARDRRRTSATTRGKCIGSR